MTRTLAYRHFRETVVHLYTDCPEGKVISIARRDAVKDESAVPEQDLCEWCKGKMWSEVTKVMPRRRNLWVSGELSVEVD